MNPEPDVVIKFVVCSCHESFFFRVLRFSPLHQSQHFDQDFVISISNFNCNFFSDLVPFSVQVIAQIENIPWHEDLTSPETEGYRLITNNIRSNVSLIHCFKKLDPP